MSKPKKPYYKLTIGAKPYTSADLRFNCGRLRIEVSDAHPDHGSVMASLIDDRWGPACRKMLAFYDAAPAASVADFLAGRGVSLTEPEDHTLRAEVARLDAARAAKAGAS